MGIETRNIPANMYGTYSNVEKDTIDALKKAGNITTKSLEQIEEVAKGGKLYSKGEELLISDVKNSIKTGATVNFNFVDTKAVKDFNTIVLKGQEGSINNNEVNISKSRLDTKRSIDFVKDFSNSTDEVKGKTIEILSSLDKSKPESLSELEVFKNKIPDNMKKQFDDLGINKLNTNTEIKDFFESKNVNRMQTFLTNFDKLNPNEKEVTLKSMDLLSDANPKPNFRKQLLDMNNSIGVDSSMKVGKLLNSLNMYLPSTTLTAPTSEDFSSRTKTIHTGDYGHSDSPNADYIRDVLAVGKKENFSVTIQTSSKNKPEELKNRIFEDLKSKEKLSPDEAKNIVDNHLKIVVTPDSGAEWAEDNKFFTIDGELKTLPFIPEGKEISKALDYSKTYITPNSPYFLEEGSHSVGWSEKDPNNLIDREADQGAVNERNEMEQASQLGEAIGKKVITTRTYNEGGNMLVGTMPNGESYATLGRDAVIISTFKLEADYAKDKKLVPEFDNIDKKVKEMQEQGKFGPTRIQETITRLKSSDSIPKGSDPKKIAKEFLAKIEIVKDDIFPKDLCIPKERIAYVPQADFHIDMHMRPLKPGQMAINDFDENIKILQEAKKHTKKGSDDDKELDSMIKDSKAMKTAMSPIMGAIEKELKKKGIEVVRMPGVIKGENKLVNFMNAVPGTTSGSNRQFYMTNNTSIKPLRDAFETYMKKHDVEKVYWMGDSDVPTKTTLTGAERSLRSAGGMDCRENREEF
ncbi:MAG: hypothetical protein AABZ74_06295 [Cyanobacteriota bacterium]